MQHEESSLFSSRVEAIPDESTAKAATVSYCTLATYRIITYDCPFDVSVTVRH